MLLKVDVHQNEFDVTAQQQVTNNTKALMALDQLLLERLSANTGNLLDDEELIGGGNTRWSTLAGDLKRVSRFVESRASNLPRHHDCSGPCCKLGSDLAASTHGFAAEENTHLAD